jgi:phospholipid transport system transporter-binding protein
MMERTADRVVVSGAMTYANARRLLELGLAEIEGGAKVFDLEPVGELDSASLALVFAWQRAAESRGAKVSVRNPPPSLLTLAELYGVAALLPLAGS